MDFSLCCEKLLNIVSEYLVKKLNFISLIFNKKNSLNDFSFYTVLNSAYLLAIAILKPYFVTDTEASIGNKDSYFRAELALKHE